MERSDGSEPTAADVGVDDAGANAPPDVGRLSVAELKALRARISEELGARVMAKSPTLEDNPNLDPLKVDLDGLVALLPPMERAELKRLIGSTTSPDIIREIVIDFVVRKDAERRRSRHRSLTPA